MLTIHKIAAEQAFAAFEKTEKVRYTKQTNKNGSIKSRNKLFDDINIAEFVNETVDETPTCFDTYIDEEIQIAKPEK